MDFLKVFDDLAPKLYRFCLLRVSSKPLAEDLVSQTFLQVWEHLQGGGQIDSYPPFLYRVLRNLIADHFRSKASYSVPLETVEATLVDFKRLPQEMNQEIELKRIISGLNHLPKAERDILYWRFVDDLSIKEIAELSGKKPNAIYVTIFRSVKKLKNIFNSHV